MGMGDLWYRSLHYRLRASPRLGDRHHARDCRFGILEETLPERDRAEVVNYDWPSSRRSCSWGFGTPRAFIFKQTFLKQLQLLLRHLLSLSPPLFHLHGDDLIHMSRNACA